MSLGKSVLSGSLWSMASAFGDRIMGLVIFILLARMVAPEEFGLVALAAVFIEIFVTVARLGIGEALIQRKVVPDFLRNTAFWLSMTAGVFFTLLFVLLAPMIAHFYEEEALIPVIQILSLSFIIVSLGMVNESMVMRAFGFKSIALRNLTATLISGAVAIIMAFMGYGVWALVMQKMIVHLVHTILMWKSYFFVPLLQFSKRGAKELTAFGGFVTMTNFIGVSGRYIFDLIIGAFLGVAAVGFFRIAWKGFDILLDLTCKPFAKVAYTGLSTLQNDPHKFERVFTNFVMVSSCLMFPAFFGSAMIAEEVIVTVFGSQWADSSHLLPIICFLCIPKIYGMFAWGALSAKKHPDKLTILSILSLIVNGGVTYMVVSGGLEVVAMYQVLIGFVLMPVQLYFLYQYASLSPRANIMAMVPFLISSGFMCGVIYGVDLILPELGAALHMGIIIPIAALSYIGATIIMVRLFLRDHMREAAHLMPPKIGKVLNKIAAL